MKGSQPERSASISGGSSSGRATDADRTRSEGSFPRQATEFLASLCIAVALFKSFAAEGYQIQTASMAATLLGHHRDVTCPACRCQFPVNLTAGDRGGAATCPNCSLPGIRTDHLLRQEGDQLLVNRTAYEFSDPKRWDVVVFRNPRKRSEAYVKRLVGLPGEKIQIQRGDVIVNGQLQRKPFEIQKSVRILVHDHDLPAEAEHFPWQPRWHPEGDWRLDDRSFTLDRKPTPLPDENWSSLRYDHWIRAGGNYTTTVSLDRLPEGISLPTGTLSPVEYLADRKELICKGAMSDDQLSRLTGLSPDADYQSAVRDLYSASHLSPVGDLCSYNSPNAAGTYFVPDLMLCCHLEYRGGEGEIRLKIDSGRGEYFASINFADKQVSIWKSGDLSPLRSQALPRNAFDGAARLEFSVFDRQALLVVNDQLVLEPVPFQGDSPHVSLPRSPVRIEARNAAVRISSVRLYRDIFYTPANPSRKDQVFTLDSSAEHGEYFFLGDNSPVSIDSRYWDPEQYVTRSDFLGKPFLVHLPGKTRIWKVGQWQTNIRIPDFSRIRYIR